MGQQDYGTHRGALSAARRTRARTQLGCRGRAPTACWQPRATAWAAGARVAGGGTMLCPAICWQRRATTWAAAGRQWNNDRSGAERWCFQRPTHRGKRIFSPPKYMNNNLNEIVSKWHIFGVLFLRCWYLKCKYAKHDLFSGSNEACSLCLLLYHA